MICAGVLPSIISGSIDTFSEDKYLWNTGDTTVSISADSLGTYWRRTISPGRCAAYVDTVTLGAPPVSFHHDTTICNHDTLTLSPSLQGEYPYTYLWNTGDTTASISVTTAGVYIVTGQGCYAFADTFSVSIYTFMPMYGSGKGCVGQHNGKAWI